MKNSVRKLRLKNSWTQKELSARTKTIDKTGKGISQTAISDIETYHVTVKGRNLKLLTIVFNVSENEILR